MQTRSHNTFISIHTEGALLPIDLLQRILAGDAELGGLTPDDYHLHGKEKLNEAVNRSWNRLQSAWAAFQAGRNRLENSEPGTTLTRERWLLPLFQELGYGRLATTKTVEIEGKAYPISHGWANVPIHLVGCGIDLDRRAPGVAGASKSSPHSLVQELLNRADDRLWGILSNGLRLRILRDNASLTRQAYLEFDLEAMFSGDVYADFVLLWLVCHQSRFEANGELPMATAEEPLATRRSPLTECWLEKWAKAAQERGTRALDQLRNSVEEAITVLGSGFLSHPGNQELRRKLHSGELDAQDYYRQLLRLVYRLIFLFAAEDRDLLLDPDADGASRERYLRYYSTARLRRLAERQRGSRHSDLWQGLLLATNLLGGKVETNREWSMANDETPLSTPRSPLALPVLNGFLFSDIALPDLESSQVNNQALLTAIRSLAFTVEASSLRAVDYKNLGPEELGSVYESLLELHPRIHSAAGTFELASASGHERKTTGSYYTPSSLIQVLLDSALDPVIEQAIEAANKEWNRKVSKTTQDALDKEKDSVPIESSGLMNHQGTKSSKESSVKEENLASFVSSGLVNHKVSKTTKESSDKGKDSVSFVSSGLMDHQVAKTKKDSLNKAENFVSFVSSWLLNLKICDPACGSGHFLIAAAHRIAKRLAQIQAGGDEPPPSALRSALRQVIANCIYGVDLNPMAVELCKVNLWLESIEPGKPLSFLDAHIQCGDSLVGMGPGLDISEIPDEAFKPAFGDDKAMATALRRRNRAERAGQIGLDVVLIENQEDLQAWIAQRARKFDAMPEETPEQVLQKAHSYQEYLQSPQYRRRKLEADLWTSAFFWKIEAGKGEAGMLAPTQEMLRRYRSGGSLPPELLRRVEALAGELNFFHWELAFPQVFAGDQPGFNCVLGNPSWERIKLQEEEFFATRDPEIAAAPNKAARQKLIDRLSKDNPPLADAFGQAKHAAECTSKFVRSSNSFPLTAVGDVNTYALFAERFRQLMAAQSRAGVIIPTGIATDDTTKDFFGDLVEKRAIASLFDFENREKLFQDVDSRMKFCLLTLSGAPVRQTQFIFFAANVGHLRDERRRFSLDPAEIALFNPNTRTMPVFRTRADAELTRAIYQRVPVLINERTGENPWGVSFMAMFHMSNDSGLFVTEPRPGYVRLYEAKMFWHYDHRWSTYDGEDTRDLSEREKREPNFLVRPRYWVPNDEMLSRIKDKNINWLIGFRDVTNATNERTNIFCVLPIVAVGHKAPLVFLNGIQNLSKLCFICNQNSQILDFVARQKIGGTSMGYFILKQIPVLPPENFSPMHAQFIIPRALELIYTAYDLENFPQDILDEIGIETWNKWFPHSQLTTPSSPPPFPWDEERRARLRAELDAYYARLYGLNRKQLRYILDPADLTPKELDDILDPYEEVQDPLDPQGYAERCQASTFPGETFRVLKNKDIRQYGEYRTRRLVLEAWERLTASGELPAANGEVQMASGEESSEQPVLSSKVKTGSVEHKPEPVVEVTPQAKVKAPKEDVKPVEEPPEQIAFSNFGLYKCPVCGKMVMGFDREVHVKEAHKGKQVEWKKLR